jgi:cytochrome c oxidase cbb3-type subunit III
MRVETRLTISALAAFVLCAARVVGQVAAPPQGGGRGNPNATFPAQQRAPEDPALVARGRTIYDVTCAGCHGADLRGGQLGGPNLLRSPVVLTDLDGESILPIVRGERALKGMPALALPDADVTAIAAYLHSVVGSSRGQGAPPATNAPPPDALVGNAPAGQTYFVAKCSGCHSTTGDLKGLGTRIPDTKNLQNFWVSGGNTGGGGRRTEAGAAARVVMATVTMPSGEKIDGRVARIDDFFITLALPDGRLKSIRRNGALPKVEVHDPLAPHRVLLGIYTDTSMHDLTAYLTTLK